MKTLAALFAAAVVFAPVAHAAPDYANYVCSQLEAYPTTDTLWLLIAHRIRDGAKPEDAAMIIVKAMYGTCPDQLAVLDKFVDEYGDTFGPIGFS